MKPKVACSVQATFDLSDTDWDREDEIWLNFPVQMQDTIASFKLYANGDDKASDGYTSGYIRINDLSQREFANDHRFASLTFQCGDEINDLTAEPIVSFNSGWGFSDLFYKKHVQKHSEITVSIRIDDGHDCKHLLSSAFRERSRSLYELLRSKGDIELVPIVADKAVSGKDEHDSIDDDEKRNKDTVGGLEGIDEEEKDADPQSIRMSSFMLSNASPVFKRMLANDMKESKEKRIQIPCSDRLTIDDLAYFIVTGTLGAEVDAFDLVKVAHLYQMEPLIWACLERLVHSVNPETLVKVVRVFEEFNMAKDEVVKGMYGKLLHYYHQNKYDALKEVAESHALPFCFTQWSEYMDNAQQYEREIEESDADESEVDETELQEMFIAMEEID